jgi:predicted transcriptional regulator
MEVASAVYQRGGLTAIQVMQSLSKTMGNSSVRTTLQRLESKGVIKRRREGRRYVYFPSSTEPQSRKRVLAWVASEHYEGSLELMLTEALELVDELSSADTMGSLAFDSTHRHKD